MRAETNSALYYRDGRYDMESINRSVRDAREGKAVWKLGRRRCYTVYDARSDLRTSIDYRLEVEVQYVPGYPHANVRA